MNGRILGVTAGVVALGSLAAASAQPASPEPPVPIAAAEARTADAAPSLPNLQETVVVVATREEESGFDVPISADAVIGA